jgi:hypothetical protein
MADKWKALGLGLNIRLWSKEESWPALVLIREGEDPDKVLADWKQHIKGQNVESNVVALVTVCGIEPRAEYLPDAEEIDPDLEEQLRAEWMEIQNRHQHDRERGVLTDNSLIARPKGELN